MPPVSETKTKNEIQQIGSNHGTNGLHFQTHTTFSSSEDLTLRPLTFGPPPPTALPIHPTNTIVDATTQGTPQGYGLSSKDAPLNGMREEAPGKGQSSSVPTLSNGFIRDVSNAWLHTLADLCDWKSKQDKSPPNVTHLNGALTPTMAPECDKPLNELGNCFLRKETNGFSANGSTPRSDYMISTILAGSSGSVSNHDAMVTNGGDINQSSRNSKINSNETISDSTSDSKTAFKNCPEIPSLEHLRIMRNSPESSIKHGGNSEVSANQTVDASLSSIPTKNLPPRKRHMRSLVSPPTVLKSPSKSSTERISTHSSPSNEQYQPDTFIHSTASSSEPSQIELLSKDSPLNGTNSLTNVDLKKRKDMFDPLDVVQLSKRHAVDRMIASARDSPSSLESIPSSNSDNSNRGSPFAIEGSLPDSGNSSGNSSRSGEPSPCQPIMNPSILQSRLQPTLQQQLPMPSNLTMPTPSSLFQRPGDLQAHLTFQQTTRYSISQEMLTQYNGQIPQMPPLQQVPRFFSPQDPLPHPQLSQIVPNGTPATLNTSNSNFPHSKTFDIRGPIIPTTQTPPIGGTTLRPIPLHYQNGYTQGGSPHLEQSLPRHAMPHSTFQDQQPHCIRPIPPQTLAQNVFPQLTNPPVSNMWVPPTSSTQHQGLVNGFAGATQNSPMPQQQLLRNLADPVTKVTVQPPPTTTAVEYAPLKRAPGRSRLNNHVSSGLSMGDSTFLCEVCNKVFPLQRLLNRHMKCHSATKRYNCAFCGKGFNDTFDLKRHVRTHTGVRPYKCEKCGKAFTQRCSLESHLSKVHGEQHRYCYKQRRSKIFVCEECGITTETADFHYDHIKEIHPDSTELRKYQDKLQFQKLVMQQEGAADETAADGRGGLMRSRPDLSPTSELMLYREHDEAALPLQNRAEQQRRMSELRSSGDVSPVSSGSSGSGEDRMITEYQHDFKTERAEEINRSGHHNTS
ncbi:transcriptional regulator prz1 isoform X2 [Strongylocentrotus purpuratus]|uniref:C2H2-type domain-containing protein n=1 Tax=Strongylocentrotus purpuratus TaxID=7668 RepID=A0A7M7LLN5_STRPU|nr:transcriptional regulator prz1 isoform X2 [Strongylocentrotus purpuratus]